MDSTKYLFKYWQYGVGLRYHLLPFSTPAIAEGYAEMIDKRKGCEIISFYAPTQAQLSEGMNRIIKKGV